MIAELGRPRDSRRDADATKTFDQPVYPFKHLIVFTGF